MTDKKTQAKKVLKLFKTTPTVTVQFILENVAVNSPRKIISDLRKIGVPIKDQWCSNIVGDKHLPHYKEYWIDKSWWGEHGDDYLL